MVIWVTGLSGAGKTTLCKALWQFLKPQIPGLISLDGDIVREVFGNDLGFREEDRHRQIKRLQRMAKMLTEQNMCVIVAALYSHPDLLAWNREFLTDYFEIYLKASLEVLRRRDHKGLYQGALSGAIPHVVGIDIPWHEPISPDLMIEMDQPDKPETLAQQVISRVPFLSTFFEKGFKNGRHRASCSSISRT